MTSTDHLLAKELNAEICSGLKISRTVEGRRREMHIEFLWGNLKERGHLKGCKCQWGRNIKIDLKEIGYGFTDWISVAQDGGRWQVLVSMLMDLCVA
jgi:hypothetical protein